jgi:hypothetical protein
VERPLNTEGSPHADRVGDSGKSRNRSRDSHFVGQMRRAGRINMISVTAYTDPPAPVGEGGGGGLYGMAKAAVQRIAGVVDARTLNGQMISAEEFARQHGLT